MTELPDLHTGQARREHGFLQPAAGQRIPFALLEGPRKGPCLLVTAGVHGSEFCAIEVALRLARIDPTTLRGTLLVLPILNVEGFKARSIYVMPQDGKNLNRMFPGRPDGSASEQLAHWLVTHVYPKVDAYIDLHGGDLNETLTPFSLFPKGSAPSKILATVLDLPFMVETAGEGYTMSAASRLGVPSILAEIGGNGLTDEADVTRLLSGIRRVMRHLEMIDGPPGSSPHHDGTLRDAPPRVVTLWTAFAPSDGLWYPLKPLACEVESGDLVGEIRDVFGSVLANMRSEASGTLLYHMTSLSVTRGEPLLGIGIPHESLAR
jgi:uncharacterized protein